MPGMPEELKGLPEAAAALLIEVRAEDANRHEADIAQVTSVLNRFQTLFPVAFTADPAEFAKLWKVRKGCCLPSPPRVHGERRSLPRTWRSASKISPPRPSICRPCSNAMATRTPSCPGTPSTGICISFYQDFGSDDEVRRYGAFMDEIAHLVVDKYDGSLKAEHGTGRAMAPFVELEWGRDATRLMRDIKHLFDPTNLLNPGVICNSRRISICRT